MADDAGLINEVLAETSFLYGGNAAFVEDLYAQWSTDPNAVDASWRAFFASLADSADDVKRAAEEPAWTQRSAPVARPDWLSAVDGLWPAVEAKVGAKIAERAAVSPQGASTDAVRAATLDSLRAIMMIRAYRMRGHLKANLDPLGIATTPGDASELDPATYGFSDVDFERPIFLDFVLGLETSSIREILDILRRTYCGNVGVQYMHISDPKEKAWLQARIEGRDKEIVFTNQGKIAILKKLIETEGFEKFLHRRFPGTKRFGLDGGESLVPALEQIIKRGGALGVKDIIVGMPHRGRLNVLAAVMGKPYQVIFHEFQGGSSLPSDVEGSGDVKYHLGASSDRAFDGNSVHLSLTANPSHLEIVNPVVIGKARAKQAFALRASPDAGRGHVLPLLMHGDAAFAGQGVVAECFALSQLRGYGVGGSIHFIVNNQIGFTTSPKNSRSSPYPSDVALMVEAPIFHANGDDPEAVVFAAKVATEYRQQFGKDVVVDMFCYRRFGHNEGDDPTMTQPLMYAKIKDHPTVRDLYAARLVNEGTASKAEIDALIAEFDAFLDAEFDSGKAYHADKADWLDGKWSGLRLPGAEESGVTGVPKQKLLDLGRKITSIPERIVVHKTVGRVIANRRDAIEKGAGLDWATAEHLAFATLLDQGYPVRLSGQDSVRGTFVQRHCGIIDQTTEEIYFPLRNLGESQAHFEALDSALSEEAVLGFEYGFSLTDPNTLTMWEGQFGDFVNGAQVVIDQFISSGERKWLRMSGLVMLLPHGYEGQGPEHSSARLERFLQLCAEDNLQVVNCTTPANYYHALRRQMIREFRKPLIVMTPKSLLRNKAAMSPLSEFTDGRFCEVIGDSVNTGGARRVVISSGKLHWELEAAREKGGVQQGVALIRLEQLYPFPAEHLEAELARYPGAEVVWAQEEPRNQGAWLMMQDSLRDALQLGQTLSYAGRPASASTATGYAQVHAREQTAVITAALGEQVPVQTLPVQQEATAQS